MKKLNEYLVTRGIKQLVFAKQIGCVPATLHKILRKGLIPQLKTAIRIEEETGGHVNVYDWITDSKQDKQPPSPPKKKPTK